MHARSSAKRFGGVAEDYQDIHTWFDQTKATFAHVWHRAILHSSFGCFLAEQFFGVLEANRRLRAQVVALGGTPVDEPRPVTFYRVSDGRQYPIRLIAEQHITEDCGFVPTPQDWLEGAPMKEWMVRNARPLSRELEPVGAT